MTHLYSYNKHIPCNTNVLAPQGGLSRPPSIDAIHEDSSHQDFGASASYEFCQESRLPPSPTMFTVEQVKQLITRKLKKKKEGRVMLVLWYRTSHPLTRRLYPSLSLKHIISRAICEYNGKGDPIQHKQKHMSSLLGRTCYDNHFTLHFSGTLTCNASCCFFGVPTTSISSWSNLKEKFIYITWVSVNSSKMPVLWMTSDKEAIRL